MRMNLKEICQLLDWNMQYTFRIYWIANEFWKLKWNFFSEWLYEKFGCDWVWKSGKGIWIGWHGTCVWCTIIRDRWNQSVYHNNWLKLKWDYTFMSMTYYALKNGNWSQTSDFPIFCCFTLIQMFNCLYNLVIVLKYCFCLTLIISLIF